MFPAKKILCPTDFSETSIQAFSNASEIALHNQAEIYLVHVQPVLAYSDADVMMQLPGCERMLHPQQRLEKLAEPLRAKGLKVEIVITRGDPATEIVRIAKQKAVDIIVIATFGKTGWRHLAFGSVAEKVVRTSTCPVLTIRPAVHGASSATP